MLRVNSLTGFGAIKPAAGGFSVTNSLSLADTNEYLSLTFGTPTSATSWTVSVWLYRNGSSNYDGIFSASSSNGIHLRSGDIVMNYYGGGNRLGSQTISNATWHHIVVNGAGNAWVDNTSDSTGVSEGTFNNASQGHEIGRSFSLASYNLNGLLAEFVFIDGQDLTPTSFAYNNGGTWSAKDPSGLTFGNNGFYLKFANSGNMGEDSSSNGNDWTLNSVDASNQSANVPPY
jgi:hypothetical protein